MSRPYSALPVQSTGRQSMVYDSPPSPGARHTEFIPEDEPFEVHDDMPPGAGRARFMGAAAMDPDSRNSFAASHASIPSTSGDDYDSSVYALNTGPGQRESGPNLYGMNYRDDPNASEHTIGAKGSPVMRSSPYLEEKRNAYAAPRGRSRRRAIIIGSIAGVGLLIIIIAVVVYFAAIKPHHDKSSDNTSGGAAQNSASSSSAPAPTAGSTAGNLAAVTGGDGSIVTMDNGTTFVYNNSFGGYWYWDENDPFNNGARAQSWSPALNETFNYGVDPIWGVNLGGWLVLEPFIIPSLFEKFVNTSNPAQDEWVLSQNLAADTADGGISQIEQHYATFITEQDFAQIAGAGLNWVRIPLPYWAIEVRDDEPFLPKVAWTYFLKAIQWARKYGLRINVDLHTLPGSQNGWNHSGKIGTINMLLGSMGVANAQRSLDYIRIIAEFISQPEYKDVVPMFSVTNEPFGPTIGMSQLASYHLQSYDAVREASGIGEGNGPWVSLHEGFLGLSEWAGVFPNADRVALDIHQYICFNQQSTDPYSARLTVPCSTWAVPQNTSMQAFGLTIVGEFSNAINDCGLWVNGVNQGARYDGTYYLGGYPFVGNCTPWQNWQAWDDDMKSDIKQFALASMSALQNWFFWTWKIGASSVTGVVESPAWSYSLGLQEGWMPTDPREALGVCENTEPFNPPLQSWQTGGAGAGQIPASVSASYPWPPVSISSGGFATDLPSYTPTGTLVTLPPPTFTVSASATASAGDGWENPSDTQMMMVPIATCSYLDPWVGPSAPPPSPLCSPASGQRRAADPLITSPPAHRSW